VDQKGRPNDILSAVASYGFNPKATAVLETVPDLPASGLAQRIARIVSRDSDSILVSAQYEM